MLNVDAKVACNGIKFTFDEMVEIYHSHGMRMIYCEMNNGKIYYMYKYLSAIGRHHIQEMHFREFCTLPTIVGDERFPYTVFPCEITNIYSYIYTITSNNDSTFFTFNGNLKSVKDFNIFIGGRKLDKFLVNEIKNIGVALFDSSKIEFTGLNEYGSDNNRYIGLALPGKAVGFSLTSKIEEQYIFHMLNMGIERNITYYRQWLYEIESKLPESGKTHRIHFYSL